MLKYNEALKIILDNTSILDSEEIWFLNAIERTIAEDIYASSDLPSFSKSMMDGYAVIYSDVNIASSQNPVELQIVGEISAGSEFNEELKSKRAVSIMTGAKIPKGADTVIPIEYTENYDNKVIIKETFPLGANILQKGEDVKEKELIISKGTLITSGVIAMLASLGKSVVKVYRKPVVSVIATGSELVPVYKTPKEYQIRDSNSYSLYASCKRAGASVINLGIIEDNKDNLKDIILHGLSNCDILLISGGVSVGKYDLVKDILKEVGVNILFWRSAIKPGKPVLFGKKNDKFVFGLPGNPVSSLVVFEVFVKPQIYKMMGKDYGSLKAHAVMRDDLKRTAGRLEFIRGIVQCKNNKYEVHTTGKQGSAIIKSMLGANCLIVIPSDREFINRGELVDIILL